MAIDLFKNNYPTIILKIERKLARDMRYASLFPFQYSRPNKLCLWRRKYRKYATQVPPRQINLNIRIWHL